MGSGSLAPVKIEHRKDTDKHEITAASSGTTKDCMCDERIHGTDLVSKSSYHVSTSSRCTKLFQGEWITEFVVDM